MAPPSCCGNLQFEEIEMVAKMLVNETIEIAERVLQHKNSKSNISTEDFNTLRQNFMRHDYESDSGKKIFWPNISEFTKDGIVHYIDRYVRSWELTYDWTFFIDFLWECSDSCSDYYIYEVKWSIPTKEYPIPQVTVSNYFTFEVSRCKSKCSPINVTYVFEGSSLVYKPNTITFNEIWLLNVLNQKLKFISNLQF